jgi:MFS family permease
MATAADVKYHTSGLIPLTRPQLIWTMTGLMLGLLLSALDQTIVGTAEPRIIATLSGFDRYPWVATAYLLSSTVAVPIFAKLSDIYGRKWFFLGGAAMFVAASALCGAAGEFMLPTLDGMGQ